MADMVDTIITGMVGITIIGTSVTDGIILIIIIIGIHHITEDIIIIIGDITTTIITAEEVGIITDQMMFIMVQDWERVQAHGLQPIGEHQTEL